MVSKKWELDILYFIDGNEKLETDATQYIVCFPN